MKNGDEVTIYFRGSYDYGASHPYREGYEFEKKVGHILCAGNPATVIYGDDYSPKKLGIVFVTLEQLEKFKSFDELKSWDARISDEDSQYLLEPLYEFLTPNAFKSLGDI